jgi:hypothetical protein
MTKSIVTASASNPRDGEGELGTAQARLTALNTQVDGLHLHLA